MEVSIMIFKCHTPTYNSRYWAGPIGLLLQIGGLFFYLLIDGRVSEFVEKAHRLYFSDPLLTLFIFGMLFFFQISMYFITNSYLKYLDVNDTSIQWELFTNKTHKILYTELKGLRYSDDIYQNFIFEYKDGRELRIKANIRQKRQAFELMKSRIAEAAQ
jgi:hypothetical protein